MYINLSNLRIIEAVFGSKSEGERFYIVEGSPDSILKRRFIEYPVPVSQKEQEEDYGGCQVFKCIPFYDLDVPVLVIPHCGDKEYEKLRRKLGNVLGNVYFSINIDENSSLEKLSTCIIAVMEQVASFIHSVKKAKYSYIDKDGSPRQLPFDISEYGILPASIEMLNIKDKLLFDISEYGILPASIEMLNIKDKKFIFSSRLNDGEPTLAEIFIESCKKDENKSIKLVDDIFFDEDILSIPICGNSTTNKDLFCLADLIYLESTSSKSIEIDMDAFSRAVVSSKKVRNMVNPVFLKELEKRVKKSSSSWNDDRGDIFLR